MWKLSPILRLRRGFVVEDQEVSGEEVTIERVWRL
jgi:hypothetical protein